MKFQSISKRVYWMKNSWQINCPRYLRAVHIYGSDIVELTAATSELIQKYTKLEGEPYYALQVHLSLTFIFSTGYSSVCIVTLYIVLSIYWQMKIQFSVIAKKINSNHALIHISNFSHVCFINPYLQKGFVRFYCLNVPLVDYDIFIAHYSIFTQ